MSKSPTSFEALQIVVDKVGQSGLARICGVTQPAVWKWLQSSKRLPAEHVLPVEASTGVSRHVLRPDIYPIDSAAIPASAVGEDVPLYTPILSARLLSGHGNRGGSLPKSGKAA